MKHWKTIQNAFLILLASLLTTGSIQGQLNTQAKTEIYAAPYAFNYAVWTGDALLLKIGESGLELSAHIPESIQHNIVLQYFDLAQQLDLIDLDIEKIYADPTISNPGVSAAGKIEHRKQIEDQYNRLAPIVEEILQHQVSTVLEEEGIEFGGQTIPPVLYHSTPLPKALIVSPRDHIQQDANVSLLADMSLDQIEKLENKVSSDLDVSALIVDIGGVGIYPTMVQRSSSLSWVVQTIAHEWTHNYLTLHPLGMNYDTSNELRTMNETTAEIVGDEISRKVIAKYYPELQTNSSTEKSNGLASVPRAKAEDTFDFNTEMNTTRVKVDEYLKEGRIADAETYMEARRQIFVANGYYIRKLNQAYFAFYGGYAATPGGAAGEDPVGPAVRALRSQSTSLANFLEQISWMSSFSQLQKKVSR